MSTKTDQAQTDKRVAYCDVCTWGGDVFSVVRVFRRCSFADAVRWLDNHQHDITPARITRRAVRSLSADRGAEVCGPRLIYSYLDEQWNELYQKIRTPDKRFLFRRLTADGWVWALGRTRRVLYRLPDDDDAEWDSVLPQVEVPPDVMQLAF